jgi:hypothetical protein
MGGVEISPWRRYGHYRLYVTASSGDDLGYFDVDSGTVHAIDPQHRSTIQAVATDYLAGERPQAGHGTPDRPTPAEETADAGREPLPDVASSWTDLALNRPGDQAHARALAERRAAPVRTGLARLFGIHTEERAWRTGAAGELAVARELTRLGPDWRVLHAVPVGRRGSDIDHVVIGPGGVFTINAKHHARARIWVGGDTFMINGTRVPYVRNSRHEATRAASLLTAAAGRPVAVTGIIAVVGRKRAITIRQQPADRRVRVIAHKNLRGRILASSIVLDADAIEQLHTLARRSTTWAT